MNSHLLRLFFFVVPTLSVFSSNALVPLVVLVGVAATAIRYFETKQFPHFSKLQIFILLTFFGWISVSTIWSINPMGSLKLDLRLLGLTLTGLLLVYAVEQQDAQTRHNIAKALLIGSIMAAVFLLIESNFEGVITKTVKGKALDASMNVSRFNRGASFLGITFWALFAIYANRLSLIAKLLFPIIPLGLLFYAPSESTLIAVVLAAIWYLLFFALPRLGYRLLPVLLIVSILIMPFAARLIEPLYNAESSQSIPFSAKHRFFIWDFVSSQILENPVQGWGFDSARDYPNKGAENYIHVNAQGNKRLISGRIISLHPHNFALQIWLELGAVGAVLISFIIWALFGYLKKNHLAENIAIQAMMVSTFIVALLGYGIWQNRWFVMFFIFAAMIPLVQSAGKESNDGE